MDVLENIDFYVMNLGVLLKGFLSTFTGGVSNLFEGDNLGNLLNNAGSTAADIGNQNMAGNLVAKLTGSRLTDAERAANSFNSLEAQKQRDFEQSMFNQQTELANTAYQRQVADMQAAGVNPMMAVSGSGGSAVPSAASGSAASSVSPAGASLNLGTLLQLALDFKMLPAKLANMAADTAKKSAEAASTEQQTDFASKLFSLNESGLNLSNDLKRGQIKEIEQSINESKSRERNNLAQAVLANANADNVVYMRPFISAELEAKTDLEKKQSRAAAVAAAYQQHLLDAGVIEMSLKESGANIKVSEAIAELDRIQALIQKGDKHALSKELGLLDKIDFWAKDVLGAITKVVDSVPINFVVK